MEKPRNTPQIPHTDSIEELAKFWDTHDLSDCEEGVEEVQEPVLERRDEARVTIPLSTPDIEAVKRLAQAEGMGHTARIREWVLEKLHHPSSV